MRPTAELAAAIVKRSMKMEDINKMGLIGSVAYWGSNALLAGMAFLTYAVFVLLK